jgi:hypothetical protein
MFLLNSKIEKQCCMKKVPVCKSVHFEAVPQDRLYRYIQRCAVDPASRVSLSPEAVPQDRLYRVHPTLRGGFHYLRDSAHDLKPFRRTGYTSTSNAARWIYLLERFRSRPKAVPQDRLYRYIQRCAVDLLA